MSTNGVLRLGEARARLAAALAPARPSDPDVLANYEDALEPPVLMLQWQDPWLEPRPAVTAGRTFGPCLWVARLAVFCVAGRVEPTPNIETLEHLVAYTVERVRADSYPWPVATVTAPRPVVFGDIRYQAATVNYGVTVTTRKDDTDG